MRKAVIAAVLAGVMVFSGFSVAKIGRKEAPEKVATACTTTEAEPEEEEPEARVEISTPVYSVNGEMLEPELQQYIYNCMEDWLTPEEREQVFPVWLAVIYQESKYDPNATNGRDWGYCQLRDTYHSEFIEGCGLPEGTDLKNDLYSNLYAGTWLFCQKFKTYDNVSDAIRHYYNSGNITADNQYLHDVTQWIPKLEKAR